MKLNRSGKGHSCDCSHAVHEKVDLCSAASPCFPIHQREPESPAGRTLKSLNYSLKDRISDHNPLIVDLPLGVQAGRESSN
jgi:hypothetical protein